MNIPEITLKIKRLDWKSLGKLLEEAPDVIIAILLVITGFFGGFTTGFYYNKREAVPRAPITYEPPKRITDVSIPNGNSTAEAISTKNSSYSKTKTIPSTASGGNITASKNGTVYYLSTCQSSRIKPENIITFSSESEAQAAGYTLSKTCTKNDK